jgi:endonuclease/exonuclease/phosphatase family metal-dependent hydrolase
LHEWLVDADVVVMPEAWRDHGAAGVVDRLSELGWSTLETEFVNLDMTGRPVVATPGSGMWSLALASKLPMRLVRMIPLPRTYQDPVPRRHAIHVEIDIGSTTVDLVAYHVSSKLWFAAPPAQLLGLRRAVRTLGRARPAILVGDANWWRSTLPVWLPGWRSTVRGATFPAHKPHSQIDHVLVRGGLHMRRGDVAAESWRSDHRAIRTTLSLPERF